MGSANCCGSDNFDKKEKGKKRTKICIFQLKLKK